MSDKSTKEKVKSAKDHFEKIDANRREFDGISADMKERSIEKLESICDDFFGSDTPDTLRSFLEPLDLHFDPEEFIDDNDDRRVTPEVLATATYKKTVPETLGKFASDEINDKYLFPYTNMSEDEFFMIEEYIFSYHD